MTSGPTKKRTTSDYEALFAAQRIAFAPLMFQAARVMRDSGLLAALDEAGEKGLDATALSGAIGLSDYAVGVLVDAGLEIDAVERHGDRLSLTATGRCLAGDAMTRVNMDFVHQLCYRGLHRLDESLATGRPAGLRDLDADLGGEPDRWETLYQALPELPSTAQESWRAFDQYYSGAAFRSASRWVLERRPATLLDVGGNDGQWAVRCLEADPALEVTLLDYPAQCDKARRRAAEHDVADRLKTVGAELREHDRPFPAPFDAVWMSQFLSCFPPDDGVALLRRAAAALGDAGRVWILETCPDRQRFGVGRYCLRAISLYFAGLATGDSRMYESATLIGFVEAAGLRVERIHDGLGTGSSLFECCLRAAPATTPKYR